MVLSADLESGGSYQCRATTELEEISVEHRLKVMARTHFRLSPSHTTVIQVMLSNYINLSPLTSHLSPDL